MRRTASTIRSGEGLGPDTSRTEETGSRVDLDTHGMGVSVPTSDPIRAARSPDDPASEAILVVVGARSWATP
jgi:hypothetical protein